MEFKIIDAHAHLWLSQDTEVNGQRIQTLEGGKSLFMGEVRQMVPPFMVDGRNTAEIFLANMNYAQVSAAVITQEYIDGLQNAYLSEIEDKYPDRFMCCGMFDVRQPNYVKHAKKLIGHGFRALKIPAQHFFFPEGRLYLTSEPMMEIFKLMEKNDILLSIDLADGGRQVGEMKEVIAECPELRIAIGHFGMVNRGEWKEQIQLAQNKNVMIESGGITWLFNDEFYPFTNAVKAIQEAAGMVGMDKLMWGSDYPRTITAITYRMSYDFVLKSKSLVDEEKAMFLGENAERFYRFKSLIELPYIKNMSE